MKNCLNCKYGDLLITAEPCNVCKYSENWKPEDDKNENTNQDTV